MGRESRHTSVRTEYLCLRLLPPSRNVHISQSRLNVGEASVSHATLRSTVLRRISGMSTLILTSRKERVTHELWRHQVLTPVAFISKNACKPFSSALREAR